MSIQRAVLMVAFHFPPCTGTSGVHRADKFVRYLPLFGWRPLVVTAHPRAYPSLDPHASGSPKDFGDLVLARAFALDVARHLSIRGRYPRLAALPDRWVSWWPFAFFAGLRLIRRFRPAAIWSTYPIATAHLVAFALHRCTGLPWAADFRDPMAEEDYPPDPVLRFCHERIERLAAAHASLLIFTTASACAYYRERHRLRSRPRTTVIPNGYDDVDFEGLPVSGSSPIPLGRPVRILHSGMLYGQERDPSPLLRALATLSSRGAVDPSRLTILFRGPFDDPRLRNQIAAYNLDDLVSLLPPVPHLEALREAAQADALLLIQGPSCNRQIPAKVYEYLRLGRPILALTDPAGDTALLLRRTGGATVLALDPALIASRLPEFLSAVRNGLHPPPIREVVETFNRRAQSALLAASLDTMTSAPLDCLAAARFSLEH